MTLTHHARAGSAGRTAHRIAAVLAGGLVAGIGTVTTLASWNDSEYASASFTAGRFDLEGSLDGGTTYSQHGTPGAAPGLTFTTATNNLSPGEVVDAAFPVRLAAGTTHDATLSVRKAGYTGAMTGIGVIVWYAPTSDCTVTYNPATLLAYTDGTSLYSGVRPVITRGSTTLTAGTPINVCFRMMASEDLPQGQTGSFTWQLTATSTAP